MKVWVVSEWQVEGFVVLGVYTNVVRALQVEAEDMTNRYVEEYYLDDYGPGPARITAPPKKGKLFPQHDNDDRDCPYNWYGIGDDHGSKDCTCPVY